MTKPLKIYQRLLADRSLLVSFRDLERLLEAFGWSLKRIKGSHRHYYHPQVPNILTINPDGASAHRY
jgi:predicted RNA binding protein YcfA (HicA-like mRNA interferase family)